MSAPAPPPTPTVIAGRYELQRWLAQGGMAEVWLAYDRVLDRKVAVKWLKPSLASDAVVAERFRREAVAAASLNHPNIVSVHDVFEQDGRQAVVMQLVDGKSLRQLLDKQKRLSPLLTCHIGTCVAAALDHAHAAGFVHRDVKPANIMITPDGQVLLTDFGIAKAQHGVEEDLTSDNIMMGTAKYLSPEQVSGKTLDGRADLYSLGLVLYECLAGRVPFLGETDAATALARLQRDPTDLARLRATLPPSLVQVIHDLLERNPEHRPATGAELARILDAAKDEEPPPIDPTPMERRPGPFVAGRLRRAPSDQRAPSDRHPTVADDRSDADTAAGGTAAAPSAGTTPARPSTPPTPAGPSTQPATVGAPAAPAIPGEPSRAPSIGPAAPRDPTPRSTARQGVPRKGMAQNVGPTKTVIGLALLAAVGVAVVLGLVLRFGGDDPTSPTSVLPGATAADGTVDGSDGSQAPVAPAPADQSPAEDGGDGGGGAAVSSSAAADPAAAAIASIVAFDPAGDGAENDVSADQAAADGDPATSWTTVCYADRFMGAKQGVGLVVSFDAPTTQALKVDVQSAPYQLQFFATDAETPPSDFDGWGPELGTGSFGAEPGTVTSQVPVAPARHMLVVLNELGPDDGCSDSNPYRGRLGEIATVG